MNFLPPQTPVSTSARWALADLRAREWFIDQTIPIKQLEIPKTKEIVHFIPHLIVQGYPLLGHISRGNLLIYIERCSYEGNPQRGVLAFVLALAMLYDASQALETQGRVEDLVDLKMQLFSSVGGFEDVVCHGESPYSTFATFFTLQILSRASSSRWVVPPKVERIPLGKLLDFGVPFGDLPRDGRLPMRISREFLEGGEWVGYYSLRMNLVATSIDPPMRTIHFQTEEVDEDGRIKLKSSGMDMVGGFELTGWVARDGRVQILKNYTVGPRWDWHGMLGPLGMIGSWSSGGRPHGMFWIWKKEWSQ